MRGESGWHQGLYRTKRGTVTLSEDSMFSMSNAHTPHANGLFRVKTEDPNNIEKYVIPPTLFIGGPRDMKRGYLNAMALVQRFGKPDLFLTMTCNLAWLEIQELMQPWETPQDHSDVVVRLFRAKVMHLKDLIIKKQIFGSVAAHVDVVEFQKRGLPHLHMLVILNSTDKVRSSDQYDSYVRAELPPLYDSLLRSRVVQYMMHGSCGSLNPHYGCMKEKKDIKYVDFDTQRIFH
ncbi:hypothetical protein V2J09_006413 [Rumex salicifolius]